MKISCVNKELIKLFVSIWKKRKLFLFDERATWYGSPLHVILLYSKVKKIDYGSFLIHWAIIAPTSASIVP